MSEPLWRAIAAALLVAISALLVRECGGRLGGLVSLAGGLALLSLALDGVSRLRAGLSALPLELSAEPILSLLEVIALSWLVEVSASIVRDLGEPSLASRLELVGRIEILVLALPALGELLSLALPLISAE